MNKELEKKAKSLDAMFPEIDSLCEMNSQLEDSQAKLQDQKAALEKMAKDEERRRIQAELASTQKDMRINELKNELGPRSTAELKLEVSQID